MYLEGEGLIHNASYLSVMSGDSFVDAIENGTILYVADSVLS